MKPLAVPLLLCLTLLGGSGCLLPQSPRETYSLGAMESVNTKGSYEVAAHCFSREFRNADKGIFYFTVFGSPALENDPSQDYAELFFVTTNRSHHAIVIKFLNAGDGNSTAEIYLSNYFPHIWWVSRAKVGKELVEMTAKCQLEEGAESEEGRFKSEKADGLRTSWYENGKKEYEGNYKDGKKDGLFTFWMENGKKFIEQNYKNGEKDGLSTRWHDNGQKMFEMNYKDGKKNGLATDWYENGQKESEENYKNGKKDGRVTEWHDNGEKKSEAIFKKGKPVEQLCCD